MIVIPCLFWDLFVLAMRSYFPFFFFFSSRRRHTRCSRDWSSDVCSSDLAFLPEAAGVRCRITPGRLSFEERMRILTRQDDDVELFLQLPGANHGVHDGRVRDLPRVEHPARPALVDRRDVGAVQPDARCRARLEAGMDGGRVRGWDRSRERRADRGG